MPPPGATRQRWRASSVGRLGVDGVVVNATIGAPHETAELEKVGIVASEGRTWGVPVTGVGVLAVVHLKRGTGGAGKSFNKGDEVELTDLRGSAALEQLSWNVIALERDQQSMDKCDVSHIRLLKNREWGYTGLCDTMMYDHTTGRLKAFDVTL